VRLERILTLAQYGLSFDTETWRLVAGNLCPPLVCGSAAWFTHGPRIEGVLLDKQQTVEVFAKALDDPNAVLVMANGAFDLGVMSTELGKQGIDAMPWIFNALEQGRVWDLQIAEALHAIANGHLGKDPRTGGALKNPETGKPGSYSLSMCVSLTLGREDAKANDEWRLNYHMLDGVPLTQWPSAARDYPVDDARNQLEVALAQAGIVARVGRDHDWIKLQREDGSTYSQCKDCSTTRASADCIKRKPNRNLYQVADQTYSAFCLHLGAAWGFRVDQASVDIIERYYLAKREKLIQPFVERELVWKDEDGVYHENQNVVKRLNALAYGAKDPCPYCSGSGKIPSPTQKGLVCPDCRGRCQPWKFKGEMREPTVPSCARCHSSGKIPHPNPKLINCVLKGKKATEGSDEEDEGDTKTCDGTGLVLVSAVPRSDGGGVAIGRDDLVNSGDEFLMAYGGYKEDEKILKDYVPYLRTARVPAAGHGPQCPFTLGTKKPRCNCDGPYIDIPLLLRPNAVLETGRVSYFGYIQLFPRKPGFMDKEWGLLTGDPYVPSLRECIVPRGPRYEQVQVPDGYVLQPGEFLAA
jgi:hypothetical protein